MARRSFDDYREFPDLRTFFPIGSLNIGFRPDSTVTFVSSRALDILIQWNIPVERIRICGQCDDLYLTKRSGTSYCPKSKCKIAYQNNLKAIRRDGEELEDLREKYRILMKELEGYQGKSSWHSDARESIERDLAETKRCGLKVRRRVEDRLKKWRMNSYGRQP
jgi:hypothetical protein